MQLHCYRGCANFDLLLALHTRGAVNRLHLIYKAFLEEGPIIL